MSEETHAWPLDVRHGDTASVTASGDGLVTTILHLHGAIGNGHRMLIDTDPSWLGVP